MADVEQMKKIFPLTKCEITFGQYVRKLMFVVLSHNHRATLWVLDTCLIVGLLPLIIILNTASLFSKTFFIAPNREDLTLDEKWSTLFRSRLTCLVGFWFFMWSVVFRDRFPCDSWPLDLLIWFGGEWNTPITKSQRWSAGSPSMRKPASRETSSASVKLCEIDVCFLRIQLVGKNVWLPKMHKSLPDVDFWVFKNSCEIRVLKQS